MLTQEIKNQASKLQDEKSWFKLLLLILQFGTELIKYLRERKTKNNDNTISSSDPLHR